MSATDSESSIDWLATDNEEDEDHESDGATGRAAQPYGTALSPGGPALRRGPPESNGDRGILRHGRRSDPVKRACAGVWMAASGGGSDARRPGQPQAGGEARSVRNPLKRPHSLIGGQQAPPQPLSNQEGREQAFTSKCTALQCYIHPLSAILNGLRSGRYRERLSSFQESVALDRIQRIMGVLQNPCMGEKYVNIILKMEEMLKSWFPNVKPQEQQTVAQTEHEAPNKILKLSSLATTELTASPASLVSPGPTAHGPQAQRVADRSPAGALSAASRLTWLHASPICSPSAGRLAAPLPPPPQQPAPTQQAQALEGPRHTSPAPRDKKLTQDSAVSSSTDRHAKTDAAPPLKPPLLGKKINAPCLERLLKSTESIISHKASGRAVADS